MKADQLQRELEVVYSEWKASLRLQTSEASQLSPPLLLSISEAYTSAKRRLLFVGQETYGWGWTRNLQEKFPKYPRAYLYNDITSMKDFIEDSQSIDALCWGYREFDFAKYQPKNYRSPFWQAFREVGKWTDSVSIWNNISRCDYNEGSILKAPIDLQNRLNRIQSDLFIKELEILQPTDCIFFTGPHYDALLSQMFPQLRYSPIDDIAVRQLARIHDPRLPACSFRTYHPNYLSRSQHWDYLDKIRELVVAET